MGNNQYFFRTRKNCQNSYIIENLLIGRVPYFRNLLINTPSKLINYSPNP